MSSLSATALAWLAAVREQHPKKFYGTLLVLAWQIYQNFFRRWKSVRGKVVLITGAGSGLGRNLAFRFARLGAKVILWDVNEPGLAQVAEGIARDPEVNKSGGEVYKYRVDVTDRELVLKTAEDVFNTAGKVDILINNAGIVSGDWITELTQQKVELTFKVNTISHFWTTQAVLPRMMADNSGHIVTVASAAGLAGVPRMTDYCASKSAAIGFDESLRVELRRRGKSGVKTTCICPFYINTGMFDGVKTRWPLILPILSENYASKEILNAILTDSAMLYMPRILYTVPVLRALPVWLVDWISEFLGAQHSMDNFKGRAKKDD